VNLEPGTIIASHHIWCGDKYELKPPVWGVVVGNNNYHTVAAALLNYEREPFITEDGIPRWHNGSGRGWEYSADEYDIVPDDEVPDEVWVALAKWRLTQ
jgi:hypothetical protein